MVATPKMIGARIKRKEDPRFITGTGKYTDDVKLPGMVYLSLLRSDRASATIESINVDKAKALDGVVAVYTGKDLDGKMAPVPCGCVTPEGKHYSLLVDMKVPAFPVIAVDRVAFVGQNVAAVVARDPYIAQDAVEAIEVTYKDRPVVVDPEKAADPSSPVIHEDLGTNISYHVPGGPSEEMVNKTEELLKSADHTASFRFDNQRLIPMAMEPRATVADYVLRSHGKASSTNHT